MRKCLMCKREGELKGLDSLGSFLRTSSEALAGGRGRRTTLDANPSWAHFVLTKLFNLSEKECQELLETGGVVGRELSIKICGNCVRFVTEFRDRHEELLKLERKLESMRKEAHGKLLGLRLEDGGHGGNVKNVLEGSGFVQDRIRSYFRGVFDILGTLSPSPSASQSKCNQDQDRTNISGISKMKVGLGQETRARGAGRTGNPIHHRILINEESDDETDEDKTDKDFEASSAEEEDSSDEEMSSLSNSDSSSTSSSDEVSTYRTSTRATPSVKGSKPNNDPSSSASSSKLGIARRKKRSIITTWDYASVLQIIPVMYRPSEWLSEVFPKRNPYFPQLGDDLVYYKQGHEAYIERVENMVYTITKKSKKLLPYIQYPHLLRAPVSVRVVQLKLEFAPPRVANVTLAETSWETGEPTGFTFDVRYHDMPDVVDFLILRQIHDKYIRSDWSVGDKFRCLIGKSWWIGTVDNLKSQEDRFPQSKFCCYNITWDNGEKDTMSPWDMDKIPDSFEIPPKNTGAVLASEEDLLIGRYEATASDWPPNGDRDGQCAKISRLIEQVMDLTISEPFRTPVDLTRFPEYFIKIEYPMDLSTIKARLDNRFYRRVDAVKFDVKYIEINAKTFNRPDCDIIKHSEIVTELCHKLISNPNIRDVNSVYHNIVNKALNKEEAEAKAKPGLGASKGNAARGPPRSMKRQKRTE